MDEEQDSEKVASDSAQDSSEPTLRPPISPRALVATLAAIALFAGGLAVFSHLTNSENRTLESQRLALLESWQQAEKDRAQGVDFELSVGNSDLKHSPSLSFDHSGTVSATDECFEGSSDYIVRSDGSLAIKDLTGAKQVGQSANCDVAGLTPLFLTARLSFGGDGWTAYDAGGEKLIGGLMERMPELSGELPEGEAE